MTPIRYGRAYLQSAHWAQTRERYEADARAPHCCAVCGAPRYELHHRTYERLGAEQTRDLMALCRQHHEALHRAYKVHLRTHPADPLRAFTDAWVLIRRRGYRTAPLPGLALYGLRA